MWFPKLDTVAAEEKFLGAPGECGSALRALIRVDQIQKKVASKQCAAADAVAMLRGDRQNNGRTQVTCVYVQLHLKTFGGCGIVVEDSPGNRAVFVAETHQNGDVFADHIDRE